jgi:hypothetical protein
MLAFALVVSAHSADAHGIAGNRFFVGTLTFDDPAVADEAIVPNFSTLNHPVFLMGGAIKITGPEESTLKRKGASHDHRL